MALGGGGWAGPVKPTYLSLPEPKNGASVALATGQPKVQPVSATSRDEATKGDYLWYQQYQYDTSLFGYDVARDAVRRELESYYINNPDAMFNANRDPKVQSAVQILNQIASQEITTRSFTGIMKENARRRTADWDLIKEKGTAQDIAMNFSGDAMVPVVVDGRAITNEEFINRQELLPLRSAEGTPIIYSSVGDQNYRGEWNKFVVDTLKAATGSHAGYGAPAIVNESGRQTTANNYNNYAEFLQRIKYTSNKNEIQAMANAMLDKIPDVAKKDLLQQYWREAYAGTLGAPKIIAEGKKLSYARAKDGSVIQNQVWVDAIGKAMAGVKLTEDDKRALHEHQAWYAAGKVNSNVDAFVKTDMSESLTKISSSDSGTLRDDSGMIAVPAKQITAMIPMRDMSAKNRYADYDEDSYNDWRGKLLQASKPITVWQNINLADASSINDELFKQAKQGNGLNPRILGPNTHFLTENLEPQDMKILRDAGAIMIGVSTEAINMYKPVQGKTVADGYDDYYYPGYKNIDEQAKKYNLATDANKQKYVKVYFAVEGDADRSWGTGDRASQMRRNLRVVSSSGTQIVIPEEEDLPHYQSTAKDGALKELANVFPGSSKVTVMPVYIPYDNISNLYKTAAGKPVVQYTPASSEEMSQGGMPEGSLRTEVR